ncbi:MAG: hypothetical protein LBD31_04525 [Treponema sp.]|jgi:hypothetical protein|nr:hypothetical protein [Treponema sp.]
MKKHGMWKLFAALIITTRLGAQESGRQDVESSTKLEFLVSSSPEMQIGVIQEFVFPFLRGDEPLNKTNGMALQLAGYLTPFTLESSAAAVWTPAPFFSVSLGGWAGIGWNYSIQDMVTFKGMGLYYSDGADEWTEGSGLDGVVWKFHAGATVQFDLAAFWPGDWHHVVVRSYHEIHYRAYSGAEGGEWWYWKMDDGINQNAFRYHFTVFAGYAMPVFLDLAGFYIEGTAQFFNPAAGKRIEGQGVGLELSLLLNFRITDRFSILTRTRIKHKLEHPITGDFKRTWAFNGIAAAATLIL